MILTAGIWKVERCALIGESDLFEREPRDPVRGLYEVEGGGIAS